MLIFFSFVGLDWGNCQELEAAHAANNENNLIEEANSDDPKAAAKQLKREKQKQKRIGEQAKKRQDVVLDEDPNEDQDEFSASLSAPGLALSQPVSLSTSRSGPTSSLPVSPSASFSGPVSSLPVSPSASRSSPASFLPVSPSASRSGPASFLPVSPSASRSGLASFLPVSPSATRSGPASSLPVSPSASRFGPALPLLFSLPASRFSPASFPSHSGSPSPVSPTFTRRAFSPVVSRNSLVCQQSAPRARRCSSLPREHEDNLVGLIRIPKKRLQEEVDKTNQKRLRFQLMAATREEETDRLMISCCPCTLKVKLNTN